MRVRVLFVGLALLLTMCSSLSAQSDTIEIRNVLNDQVRAWNEGSVEGYMAGYWNSDSTTFVSGGNVVRGFREVQARYKKSYNSKEKMGHLEFGELTIRQVTHDLAIASGAWELARAGDKPGGRFTLILERKPEGWRIVYDHTSSR
ncbi:MAG TPA: DUF4440 domain-containing protein [Bacteroidota bacterium]|nr:DUF4440 domain-containing protein [Bacteroidota bacterium]